MIPFFKKPKKCNLPSVIICNSALHYWLVREGLELKKTKDGYRFTSEYNESYFAWDKNQNKI